MIFDFETDFAGTLHCIPMCVRLKLDQCGVKVTLKQWNRLPPGDRRQLVAESDDPSHDATYREHVVSLIEKFAGGGATFLPIDTEPEWSVATRVPPRITAYAEALGIVPPSKAQWLSFSSLQRFALFKLTRPGHDNDNFVPAMREFGLIS